MSKAPGGVTVTINCLIISGFPGIGKTSTFNEMKRDFIGAKCVDMDVKEYGTTNGIDVEDPAAYVSKMKKLSTENACIFCTIDPKVRALMREAGLFYVVLSPEFPPAMASAIPNFRPDPLVRSRFMRRFSDNLGYNSLAAQTLDGKGYEDVIVDCFQDPMPHIVSENLNKAVVDQVWYQLEQMSRQTLTPGMLSSFPGAPSMPPDMPPFPAPPPGTIPFPGMPGSN